MTQLLSKVFEEAAKLPEPEQKAFANWTLPEFASEQRWTKTFKESQGQLPQPANEALEVWTKTPFFWKSHMISS